MALTHKQKIGKWTVTSDYLYARSFDAGETFWLCQQVAGTIDGAGDTFIPREPHMLTAQKDSIEFYQMTATEAEALVPEFEKWIYEGDTVSTTTRTVHGLGKGYPTNLDPGTGYAKIFYNNDPNSKAYQKAGTTPGTATTASTTDAAAADTGFWAKYKKYFYWAGGAILAILGLLGLRRLTRKGKK